MLKIERRGASVNAYLVLRNGNHVLFGLRQNTGYCDGMWSLVAGHVEDGEAASMAMIREAKEEIGIEIENLKCVHIMHRKTDRLNVDIFFECPNWSGILENMEPHKCSDLQFFELSHLPNKVIDYIALALLCISKNQFYSEMGWDSLTKNRA